MVPMIYDITKIQIRFGNEITGDLNSIQNGDYIYHIYDIILISDAMEEA